MHESKQVIPGTLATARIRATYERFYDNGRSGIKMIPGSLEIWEKSLERFVPSSEFYRMHGNGNGH